MGSGVSYGDLSHSLTLKYSGDSLNCVEILISQNSDRQSNKKSHSESCS
jgi:hypothetical protein